MNRVGRLIERVSGLSLNDYFQKYIFAPIGVANMSFLPSEEAKRDLVYLNRRNRDGTVGLYPGGHILH